MTTFERRARFNSSTGETKNLVNNPPFFHFLTPIIIHEEDSTNKKTRRPSEDSNLFLPYFRIIISKDRRHFLLRARKIWSQLPLELLLVMMFQFKIDQEQKIVSVTNTGKKSCNFQSFHSILAKKH